MLDAIYIINLIQQPNRKQLTLDTINKHKLSEVFGTEVKVFPAFLGTTLEPNPEFKYSKGSYGCTLSHLECIKQAQAQGEKTILIFEDDIIVNNDFIDLWQSIQPEIPTDWKILYLGASQMLWEHIYIQNTYYRAKTTPGAFAYIVHTEIYPEIKKLFDTYHLPIDEIYQLYQEEHSCYVLYPNLIIANLDESNTRPINDWSLANRSTLFRWDISKYDISFYPHRNARIFLPHFHRAKVRQILKSSKFYR
jgi:GR25 family glycosyltransferase involved in LPS biosynthesis